MPTGAFAVKVHAIAVLLLLLPQTSIPAPPQEQTSKASIEGTVLRAGTAEPIPGARLTFRSVGEQQATVPGPNGIPGEVSIITDPQGRFIIRNLDAGSFFMTVAANGYARQEWQAPGRLAAGQILKDVVIELTPAGVVYGVIRDENGQPAVDVQVQLLQPIYKFDGRKSFRKVRSVTTNDRGEYRLYYVTPGRYYLAAGSTPQTLTPFRSAQDNPNGVQVSYALSYFPGVADLQSARLIDVRPGTDLAADVDVHREQFYRLRGRVIDTRAGRQPAAVYILMESDDVSGAGVPFRSNSTYNAADGTFEVRDVPPGSYVVRAELPKTNRPPVSGRPPTAISRVTVFNSDVDGVVMNIVEPASISGRLMIEGRELSSMPAFERILVGLEPVDFLAVRSLPQSQALKPDGTFLIDDVMPGQYKVGVCVAFVTNPSGCPRGTPDFYLKSAQFDSNDVLNEPLQFTGAAPTPLDIVLSPKPAEIEGTVMNGKQQPAAGVQVVLIPDQDRGRYDLYKVAPSDSAGHFTIRGITPGAYKVFAWEALEENAFFDSNVMEQFDPLGKPVQLSESDKVTIEVKLIPAGK
jgi:hypothetical protein